MSVSVRTDAHRRKIEKQQARREKERKKDEAEEQTAWLATFDEDGYKRCAGKHSVDKMFHLTDFRFGNLYCNECCDGAMRRGKAAAAGVKRTGTPTFASHCLVLCIPTTVEEAWHRAIACPGPFVTE